MGARDRDEDDRVAGNQPADAVDDDAAGERPARLGLGGDRGERAPGHRRVLLEGQRDEIVITPDQPGEGDDGADIAAAGGKRRGLGGDVERRGLDADGDHPPVTGGNTATSLPSRTGASSPAKT